ncbi:MAG: S8 family serine peptidase [Phycisphaeraceae bacterium]|nr:S8 family serine peptidase [Phycisphaeraceae bacterium]
MARRPGANRRLAAMSAAVSLLAAPSLAQPTRDAFDAGRRALEADPTLTRHPRSVLVRFSPITTHASRAQLRSLVRAQMHRAYPSVPEVENLTLDMDVDRAIQILRALPGIEYAEPDYVIRPQTIPNDASFGSVWGLHNTGQRIAGRSGIPDADIDAPEAWDFFTGDPEFRIAIIDGGAALAHPDLRDNIWVNPGEIPGNGIDDDHNGYVDDVNGWDFVDDDNTPSDLSGHGTHVAGIVGARGNNGIGVTGVNWRCSLVPLRLTGAGGGFVSDAIAALDYCRMMDIRVSNNSWGGIGFSQALYDAIEAAQASNHIFVAAAGNDSRSIDTIPYYPASFGLDNVICVAATNNRDALASFSNFGAGTVHLAAPGEDVLSTRPMGYGYLSGTSMSAPIVTGVVAMTCASHPKWGYRRVIDRVLASVRPVESLSDLTITGGIVNLADAVGHPPARPRNIQVAHVGDGRVLITWLDKSDNENRFGVRRQQRVDGKWRNAIFLRTPADAEEVVDSPGAGTFRYRVRAANFEGESNWTINRRIDLE